MPPRYFFHAPDSRVYGPIDFPTLQRWRAEGRLNDDSRVRSDRDGLILTYAEVAAAPPVPEAAVVPPPILPPVPTVPPVVEAHEDETPATLGDLVGQAFALYGRGFLPLWITALVLQLPVAGFNLAFPTIYNPATKLPALAPGAHLGWALLALLGVFLFSEIGCGFLTVLVRQLDDGEPFSAAAAWGEVRGRIGALLKTWLVRWLIIGSLILLVSFCYGLTLEGGLPQAGKAILLGLALLLMIPALVLFVRYLISTQVVMLEKKSGLVALRRAGDLIRFSGGTNPFSSGDLRILLFTLLPWILAGLAADLIGAGLALAVKKSVLLTLAIGVVGAATATPLMVILFVLFVREARRRVREDGDKDGSGLA